jgi:hypothetical protein
MTLLYYTQSDEREAHLFAYFLGLDCVHAEVINKTPFLLLMMAIPNYRVSILGIKLPILLHTDR